MAALAAGLDARDLEEEGEGLFPNSILSSDIMPALQQVQASAAAWTAYMKGVHLDEDGGDELPVLDSRPLLIRVLGSYASNRTHTYPAAKIPANTPEANRTFILAGTNPLLGWTGSAFLAITRIQDTDSFPSGCVLPFLTTPLPVGWTALTGRVTAIAGLPFYIAIGNTSLAVAPSVMGGHGHGIASMTAAGGLVNPLPDSGVSHSTFIAGHNTTFSTSRGNVFNNIPLYYHEHPTALDDEGGDEGYPVNVKVIYGVKA